MPQMPGLPVVEPVAQPKASPGEFGSVGGAVAELGQEVQQMAMGNLAFEGHLIEAQRYLKYKQVEIDVSKLESQAHDDLKKMVTPEEAQAVHAHFKQEVDNSFGPYMSDKALARQLHIYGQQVDVEMQNIVNARKATLIKKGDDAANKINYDKAVQEAVNTRIAGGDSQLARDTLESKLQSSVYVMGTMTPEQAELVMHKFDKDVDKGTIKAGYNSPDPAKRKQTIAQLEDDRNFPSLDDADRNAFLTAAKKRDRELSGIRESEDYNAAVNNFDELTSGMTYEGKNSVLDSPKWLKANGFVDENGQPDRKTADKLHEEVDRQETRNRRVETEKDSDVIAKHLSDVDSARMSDAKIDQIVRDEGGSPKAASALKSAMRQHINEQRSDWRFEQALSRSGERKSKKEISDQGQVTSAELFHKLAQGDSINPVDDIWGKVDSDEMTVAQALKVQSAFKAHQKEDFTRNLRRIEATPGMDQTTFSKLSSELTDAKDQQGLEGKGMDTFVDGLLKEHTEKATVNYINKWFGNLKEGRNMWDDKPASTPARPKGIPDNAVWNPATKTWQIRKQ